MFLSLKSQLQPCCEAETVEPIRKFLIKDASSNFSILPGHIGIMLYNFVANFGACTFHLPHQKHQHITNEGAYDWAQAQAEC